MRVHSVPVFVSPLLPFLTVFFFALGYGNVWCLLIAASLLHELGHLIALHFCRAQIFSVRFGALGAEIVTPQLPYRTELLCTAAGPLMNLLFCAASLLLGNDLFALIHSILFFYNCVPVYPLDGGRLLCAFLSSCMKSDAKQITGAISCVFSAAILLAAIWLFVRTSDPLPSVAAITLLLRVWLET